MNRQLAKIKIDMGSVFTTAFFIKALYTGTWQDVAFVAVMISFMGYRMWLKTKTTSTQAFEKKVTELEAEVNSIKSAIALRRSY
jgi:hypothetical protein